MYSDLFTNAKRIYVRSVILILNRALTRNIRSLYSMFIRIVIFAFDFKKWTGIKLLTSLSEETLIP